ncbi:hypothetical protein B0J14DRAFT_581420 [Halenospora varia]|nr:hypothetical protein B0J14DRAFT_581420 [Halenospora varia]
MKTSIAALAAFASMVSAHFNLNFPAARGFNEDTLGTFPCGGQDTVSSNRTAWPLSGGQIALKMGHINANVEVLLGLGNSPGSSFNYVLRQTFQETGLGAFCMTGFSLPSGLNMTEGQNATIQVVTNGDPNGGLYNCADITFSSTAASAGSACSNNTGVSVSSATVKGQPNETTTSTTSSSSAATTSKSAAVANFVGARVGGLAMAGLSALAMVL